MKALQRLVITGHWAAFIYGVFMLGFGLYRAASGELHGYDWLGLIGVFVPLVAFVFLLWIFTGKFILWPWKRSLPKQED